MQERPPHTESALRGVWGFTFIAALQIWFGIRPQEFGAGDVVSDAFRSFFTTFGVFPGVATLVGLLYTVVRRVEHGDPIKEDLSLILSALGLIVSVVGVILATVYR